MTALVLAATLCIAQDFSDCKVEKVAAGLGYTEGPVWSRDNSLIFSDIPNGKVLKWVPGQGLVTLSDNGNGTAGNALDAQGRLYSCETHARRIIRQDKKGRIEVLADKWQGKRFNAPNDVVVRKEGDVYFTDPAFGAQQDARELDFYGVFHIPRKGDLELVAKSQTRPNGIALSPNGHVLYVTDSDARSIRAYDLDKLGSASNERILVRGIEGIPDGLKTDERGNLYVAAQGIQVFTPEGKKIFTLPLSETPSNCAFGDPDLQSLYVTARNSVFRVRVPVKGSVQY
jgi:gluconolactonase